VYVCSRNSIGYSLDVLEIVFRFPSGAREFSLLQSIQSDSGAHPAFYSKGTGNFSCDNAAGARSKAWVCGRSLAGIAGSKPAGGRGSLSFVNAVCCQVEVSAMVRSLV
jgi:hypothetical protein